MDVAPIRKAMRYAHADGHTDICYSDDGKHMITCGSDGDARIWAGFDDDDPYSTVVGEKAISVAFKNEHFYIGNDNNHVQAYSFEGKSRDGIITRFTAPVTHISVSNGGKIIVSGSCDMNIHVTEKETLKDRVFTGHKAPILGVAIDPKEKYLASSSCDGSIKVWSLSEEKVLKSWDGVIEKSNDFFDAKALGRAAWTPETGRCLAIPLVKNEGFRDSLHFTVTLVERSTWNPLITLSDDFIKKAISITAFSPCGGYLAAAAIGGELLVWDINSSKTVMKDKHETGLPMTAIAWNPSGNGEIAFCDTHGQLGMFENCIPKAVGNSLSMDVVESVDLGLEKTVPLPDDFEMLDNDDDEDDENVISLEKIKAQVGLGTRSQVEEKDGESVAGLPEEEDEIKSDIQLLSHMPNLPKLQKPFQPSSTPAHLQQRFMVWNSVGIVRCYNTEEENSIDVEFHDISVHHPLHMSNYLKHTMSALTKEALVLSCEIDGEIPSKMVCILMNSWDGSKEWSVDLPEGEEAIALAAGTGWIVVATDAYYLRFFTIGGCQREVMSIPGQVVCVAGHDNQLVVVFHSAMGGNGDQCLFYQIVVVGGQSGGGPGCLVYPSQPLPLSPSKTLAWIGFTDEGSLATQDSSGFVRLLFSGNKENSLKNGNGSSWIQVCNTNANLKSNYDHYFVLGVSEKYQNVRCVLCKGSHYPQTTPRPSVVEIAMQLPVCEPQTEKSQLEEKFWRNQLLSTNIESFSKIDACYADDKEDLERTLKETVMKLFALACRSDLDFRAVELCKMMPSTQVIMLAEKYAAKLGKKHLADKIGAVITQKMEEEEQAREKLNKYQERSYSQGFNSPLLFNSDDHAFDAPSTPVEFSNSPAYSGESENILLSAKQRLKSSDIVIRPSIKSDQNPFKKNITNSDKKDKGLSCFSTPPLPTSKLVKQGTPTEAIHQSKAKQTKLLSSTKADKREEVTKSTPQRKTKGLTYMQWYNLVRDSLQEEFPELSSEQLVKISLKRYKELRQEEANEEKMSTKNEEEGSEETQIEMEANSLPKEVLEKEVTTPTLSTTPTEEVTTPTDARNKRKVLGNSTKNNSNKKAKIESSSAKLSAFMFKKS